MGNLEQDREWVLKAIVYYCENYTIDKRGIENKMASAIKIYDASSGEDVDRALSWEHTPQGYKFWGYLHYLADGDKHPLLNVGTLSPWTAAEKQMIAAMPKVKR